jgi:O-antigen/teichoic acid export membrane protein
MFSTIAALLLLTAVPFAVSFYDYPRLTPVLYVLALICFLTGFENIGVIDFQKYMTFEKVFYLQVIPKVFSFVGTVGLAFYLRNYWALVIGMLINKCASLIMGYMLQQYRPRFKLEAWRQLLGFSSWLMVNNLITYLNRHGQNILLAKVGGAPLVGIVTVSTEFATMVANEVIQPINTAAYPGYSKVSHNTERLQKTFALVFEGIAMIAIPCATGIAALAPIFVPVVLGEKWMDAIALIPSIALASILMSLMSTIDMVFISAAKQRLTTCMVGLRIMIFFPLMYFLLEQLGAPGVAYAVLISNMIVFPLYFLLLQRSFGFSILRLLKLIVRPVIAACVMFYVVNRIVESLGMMHLNLEGVFSLILVAGIGALVFVASIFLFWIIAGRPQGFEMKAFTLVKDRIRVFLGRA